MSIQYHWPEPISLKVQRVLDRYSSDVTTTHAYIFHGPKQSGCQRLASHFAQSLLCIDNDRPCGKCSSCRLILSGSHPDMFNVSVSEEKDSISVDQIRELNRFLRLSPVQGAYKVAILSTAERMTSTASNALLKIFEEPPQQVKIILVTHNIRALSFTIRSRAHSIASAPLAKNEARQWLRTQNIDSERIKTILAISQGKSELLRRFVESVALFDHISREDVFSFFQSGLPDQFAFFKRLKENGYTSDSIVAVNQDDNAMHVFLDLAELCVRDCMHMYYEPSITVNVDKQHDIISMARTRSVEQWRAILLSIRSLRHIIQSYGNSSIAWEYFCINSAI